MKEYLKILEIHKNKIYANHVETEDFDFHMHEGYQLTYTIGGTNYLITEDKTYLIPARHFVWIPPLVNHKFVHSKKVTSFVYNIYAPIFENQTKAFYTKIGIYPAPNLLIEILKTIANTVIDSNDENYTFINSFLQILPNLIDHNFDISLPISTTKPLSDILLYILNNLDQTLSLTTIAQRYSMSQRTLSRLFHNQLEISFLKYVKLARTIKAIELLLEGNHNITEIAQEIGYKSIAAFSNAFLEMTNKRPTDFIK